MTDVININDLGNQLAGTWVHRHLNFSVKAREIVAIVGGSGAGKTTLLRSIMMLQQPSEGSVTVFGEELVGCSPAVANSVRHRWGILFQQSALFSALTVLENIMMPLKEFTALDSEAREGLALLKLKLVGLPIDAANKSPAELSGGMKKRAALARALALDPALLLLDEPTSGLDPKGAYEFDHLINSLRDSLDLTVVLVSHDVSSLWRLADKVAFLGEKRVIACEPMKTLVKNPHTMIQEYFVSTLIETDGVA